MHSRSSVFPGASSNSSSGHEAWATEWRHAYGPRWHWQLALLAFLLVVRGALETLGDADLPMHLSLGEWIVRHGAVPTVEPFSWTRAGAPYYAYSWGAQVLFYLISEGGGKVALRLFHGLTVATAGASMIMLGRAAKWDPRTSLLMAAINVTIMSTLVAPVRPQAMLFTLIPLAWAFNYQALAGERGRPALVGLAVTCAVAANTHIFFPLTAVPWVIWLAHPPADKRRAFGIVAATLGGWLVSPYALAWPAVFGSNLRGNALLTFPSPISETVPGFLALNWNWLAVVAGLCLATLPWFSRDAVSPSRHRLVFGGAWLVGLIAFASAFRLLLVWWMLVLPLAAGAIRATSDLLLSSERQAIRLLRITAVWAVCAGLIASSGRFEMDAWRSEDPARARRLAPSVANGLDHLAIWLECNTRVGARGKVYTYFDYGSALTWRLRGYSMSIDGRTIFPDSVAKPEAFYDPLREPVREGPWRSADLAIMPANGAVARVLYNAAGWRRVAVVDRPPGSIALWVTGAWWSRAGNGDLPLRPLMLPDTYACATRPATAR